MQCWHKDGGYTCLEYCPPPRCNSVSQANVKSHWSARAREWDERLFGDQGCWGSADTMQRPSLARKPAQYSTTAVGASTPDPLVHGLGRALTAMCMRAQTEASSRGSCPG